MTNPLGPLLKTVTNAQWHAIHNARIEAHKQHMAGGDGFVRIFQNSYNITVERMPDWHARRLCEKFRELAGMPLDLIELMNAYGSDGDACWRVKEGCGEAFAQWLSAYIKDGGGTKVYRLNVVRLAREIAAEKAQGRGK